MRVCPICGERYAGAEIFCSKDGARIGGPDTAGDLVHRRSIPPKAVDNDPLVGSTVAKRYRVIRRLGEGGMGVVYEVEHVEIEKRMALKVLRDDFSSKPDVVERFRQEARSASKVGNPHIVDVTDFGQLPDGGVFFAMEMLEGEALDELCTGQSISLERAAPIIDQIARALQAAHDKGIVHRDLKPENIFIVPREEGDFVKILDFGIAKISDRDSEGKRLTQTGMIFGTPEYMSPEQASGKPLDHRVDVYALGCIMFEMFTGQVPYSGDSFMAILTQHMFEPIPDIKELVPNTEVPDAVLDVVYKAMSKETETRYSDMRSLREDLHRALTEADFVVDFPGREHSSSIAIGHLARGTMASGHTASRATVSMSRRKPLFIVGAVVLLSVAGLLAALATGAFSKEDKKAAESVTPVAKTEPLPVIDDSPVAPPRDTAPSTPAKIAVSLDSVPTGAVILIEGMGQVCSSAPCEIPLTVGEPVEVSAVIDEAKQSAVFTPSSQNKSLVLELDMSAKPAKKTVRKKGGRKGKTTPTKKGTTTGAAGASGGLKIPDVFKNN
ncbi:MAG: serine/threonine protein kinase [Deltaproteobacteria bacterium]|nr:serine/threonine protein kinase [Deltaproteobacteria bacterium]MBN2671714.1 serine/threonine protein kinase [Deltaproteobacteria bacterium]